MIDPIRGGRIYMFWEPLLLIAEYLRIMAMKETEQPMFSNLPEGKQSDTLAVQLRSSKINAREFHVALAAPNSPRKTDLI
jgi:hypothetical protein